MYAFEERYNTIYTVCMTSIAIKDGLRKEFQKNGFDMTIDNFAVLMRLWQQDNLSQQTLCELTCKNKSNLTRILDKMERKSMIIRTQNPADRRSFIISLTAFSHSLQNDITRIAAEYSNKIFDSLSESEIRTLNTIFSKINRALI